MKTDDIYKSIIAVLATLAFTLLFQGHLFGQHLSTSLGLQERNDDFKTFLAKQWPSYGLMFVSGGADALAENLKWHYYRDVKPTWPNIDDSKWNPDLTYVNKYKNGDPMQGPKFPGSTTILVSLTDKYHALNTTSRLTMMTAPIITINLYNNSKAKWYWLPIDWGIKFLSMAAGWHVMDKVVLQDNSK